MGMTTVDVKKYRVIDGQLCEIVPGVPPELVGGLIAERDAALAENELLWRVANAAKDVIRFTEPEWRNDVDRGDADTKLAETVAALPPRGGKGTE